jgi:hypothetical protein
MVTAHLTGTETRFLTHTPPRRAQNIVWGELFMSEALCRYGLQQYTKKCSITFLNAIATTAPYEIFALPDISTLFRRDVYPSSFTLRRLIETHRPIPILAYMFHLYNSSCYDCDADDFCDCAAGNNNIAALEWLRNPDTGDGVYPWSEWTCNGAAKNGYIGMLERLRNPKFDGGVCPWGYFTCIEAAEAGQLEALIWLRDPEKGGGVCQWNKTKCLWFARLQKHTTVVAWIRAQPDDL